MTRCWTDTGRGRIVASEDDQIFVPYGWKHDGSKRLVVWCHGAGGTYEVGPIERAVMELIGAPWVAATLTGPHTWGSDESEDAAVNCWTWAKANLGVATDSFIIWGGSMGGLTAVLTALDHPSDVAAVGIAIPAIDPEYVRLNDPNPSDLNTAAIEAEYGVGVVPAPKQAYLRGGDWDPSIPLAVWWSSDDTFTPSASTQTFIADSGAEDHPMGAVGHAYSGISAAVADFLVDYVDV